MPDEDGVITWDRDVHLLTNRFILWDLARAAVLSALLMEAVVAVMGLLAEGELVILPWQAPVLGAAALMVLMAIACLLLGNRVGMWAGVGPAGVAWASGKRERAVNRGVAAIGLLAGSATAAGAGLLATASETGAVEWRDVHRAIEHPGMRVISIRNSWRTVVRLYCTPDNHEAVRAIVRQGVARGAAERDANPTPKRSKLRSTLWVAGAVLGGALSAAWTFRPGETAVWIACAVVFCAISGFAEGLARRLFAVFALLSLAPLALLYAAEALSPFQSIFGGTEPTWTLDTGWLAVAVAGQALLMGMTLVRLLGREAR